MENEMPIAGTLQGYYHTPFPQHPHKEPPLWFQAFPLPGGCEILGAISGRVTSSSLPTPPPQNQKPDLFPSAGESQIATNLALM